MKKRMIVVAAVAAMSIAMLGGCGNSSSSSSSADATATAQNASSAESTAQELKPDFKAVSLSEDKLTKIAEYGEYTYDKFDATVTDQEVNDYYAEAVKEAVEAGEKAYEKDESIPAGHVIASGDVVNLDYTGSVDGKEFSGGKGTTDLLIGSGKFIPGFEDALIGKAIGETVTIDVTFPESYQNTELAGKAAKFECVLNYGCKEVPITVDNAYSKLFNSESKETFLANLKTYLESVKASEESSYKNEKHQEFLNQIIDNSEFADFETELTEYTDKVFEAEKKIAQYYNVELQTVYVSYGFTSEEEFKEKIKESLKKQMKTTLLMNAIAKKENIEITEDYYQTETLELAKSQSYETVADFENSYDAEFGEGSLKANLIASYIEDKLIEKYVKEK